MGGTINRSPCAYNAPCLYLNQMDNSLLNNFQGEYKTITNGLTYDNWEEVTTSTSCTWVNDNNNNNSWNWDHWVCTTTETGDDFFAEWVQQTKTTDYYISSAAERAAANRYSAFMIAHQLNTNGVDTGMCTAHVQYGAVCLMVNAANDGIDTYRLTSTEWTSVTNAGTEAQLAGFIKGIPNALQDKTAVDGSGDPSYVEWLDYYYCTGGNDVWECAAYQPLNNSDGVAERYPRFGHLESQAGYLSYVTFNGAATDFQVKNDWQLIYQGASSLIVAAAVSAIALLSF